MMRQGIDIRILVRNNNVDSALRVLKRKTKDKFVELKDKWPEIFLEPFSKNNINVDMVIQNVSSDGKTTDLTFTIKREDLQRTLEIIKSNNKIKSKEISYKNNVSK